MHIQSQKKIQNEYAMIYEYQKNFLLQQLRMLRRFVVVTETTDLRFRQMIETKLRSKNT